MSEKKAVEYVRALIRLSQEQFEKARIILWYLCEEDENSLEFLRRAIIVAEEYRPKLIGAVGQ